MAPHCSLILSPCLHTSHLHLPPLFPSFILFRTHQQPPHSSSNMPSSFLPQNLCTCYSHCLECCSPSSHLAGSSSSFRSPLMVPSLERPLCPPTGDLYPGHSLILHCALFSSLYMSQGLIWACLSPCCSPSAQLRAWHMLTARCLLMD